MYSCVLRFGTKGKKVKNINDKIVYEFIKDSFESQSFWNLHIKHLETPPLSTSLRCCVVYYDQLLKLHLFSEYLKSKSEILLGFAHPLTPDTGNIFAVRLRKEIQNMRAVWEQGVDTQCMTEAWMWRWAGGRKQILKVSVIIMCRHIETGSPRVSFVQMLPSTCIKLNYFAKFIEYAYKFHTFKVHAIYHTCIHGIKEI